MIDRYSFKTHLALSVNFFVVLASKKIYLCFSCFFFFSSQGGIGKN